MSKRPRAPTSQGKPSLKKTKKRYEAEASARMPEVIPPDAEKQEEEEKEEAAPTLHPRGLRSRGPVILAERESLHVNLPWPKGLNGLKKWWRGLKLRFVEFQLGMELLRLKREVEVQQPGL